MRLAAISPDTVTVNTAFPFYDERLNIPTAAASAAAQTPDCLTGSGPLAPGQVYCSTPAAVSWWDSPTQIFNLTRLQAVLAGCGLLFSLLLLKGRR